MKSILSNPYFKKVSKQDDVNSGKPATYGSIGTKILFFLLLTCIGVCLSIFLSIPDNYMNYVNKYEWSLAFGLVMTVILIFVRVLNLLAKIMSTVDN